MTPSSATGLDEKALARATVAAASSMPLGQMHTARDSAERIIRAYMSALTVTSFPPAEQHDVTSHAVPHDGEGAVAWFITYDDGESDVCSEKETADLSIAAYVEATGGKATAAPLFTHPAPVAAQPAEGIPLGYRYRSHYDGAWQHWPLTAWNSDVGAAYRERHPEAEPYFTEPEDALSALPAQPNSSERQKALEEAISAATAFNEEYGDPADTFHHGRSLIDAIRALATNPEPKL